MKLIQAVKMLKDAGLETEMHYVEPYINLSGEERLALFGVRRWHYSEGYNIVNERDIVISLHVIGATINRLSAMRFNDDLANGLAKSRAREAAKMAKAA